MLLILFAIIISLILAAMMGGVIADWVSSPDDETLVDIFRKHKVGLMNSLGALMKLMKRIY